MVAVGGIGDVRDTHSANNAFAAATRASFWRASRAVVELASREVAKMTCEKRMMIRLKFD